MGLNLFLIKIKDFENLYYKHINLKGEVLLIPLLEICWDILVSKYFFLCLSR
jgi:hypothetical protein